MLLVITPLVRAAADEQMGYFFWFTYFTIAEFDGVAGVGSPG
jgi:hypothetical protein